MTEKEKTELHAEIADAVAKAVAACLAHSEHTCRFDDDEAKLLHQVSEDIDRKALIALGRMARAWDTASVYIGRVILLAFLALLVWGLANLQKVGVSP